MLRAIVCSAGLFLLAGCAEQYHRTVEELFGKQEEAKPVAASEPRYCYRTIGKVNCYPEPLEGNEANRLVGYSGPAPRSTSATGPLRP